MRGEILNFNDQSGSGFISGEDGVRYSFNRADIHGEGVIRPGARVDFVPVNEMATQIMILAGAATLTVGSTPTPGGAYDFTSAMFSFHGRLRRQHFWISWLILFGASFVVGLIPILGILLALAMYWPYFAIAVKRLHDMGRSGWFVLAPIGVNIIGFVVAFGMIGAAAVGNAAALENEDPAAIFALIGPAFGIFGLLFLLNIAFLLWIGIVDSQPGKNRFGPNPKTPLADAAETFS